MAISVEPSPDADGLYRTGNQCQWFIGEKILTSLPVVIFLDTQDRFPYSQPTRKQFLAKSF